MGRPKLAPGEAHSERVVVHLRSEDLAKLARWAQVQGVRIGELAREILEIFHAQGVHREAIGAVILFQEAAEQERVTADLVRRLQDFLMKARTNPKLRFKQKE